MFADVVDCGELNCALCGGPILQVTCELHGSQENASVRAGTLRCIEWDYDRGDECWQRLQVECSVCGDCDIEGLSNDDA